MEGSLKAGRATAWHECEMVSYFNICDDHILWSNMGGEVTVCPLSSLGDVAGTDQYDWEDRGRPSPASYISCQDTISEYDEVQQVQLISRSEILLKVLVYHQPGDSYGENATKFVKVSVQGSILWELAVGPCSSEAAIGRDAMYYFHGPPWAQDDLEIRNASLSKVSLHDGSCIFEKTMPEDLNGVDLDLQGLNFVDKSLSLSDNESLIRWGDEDGAQNICTTSPEQFSITQWSREEDEWQDAGSPSYLEPGFWELSSSWAKLTTYNKHEDSFKNDRYRLPKPIAASTIWGFDQHYSTMFYLIDDVVQRAQTRKAYRTTAPPAKIGIVKVEENNSKSCLSMRRAGPVRLITLPEKSAEHGRRDELQLRMASRFWPEGFLGVRDGHLVHHGSTSENLTLVNFWPTW